MPPPLMPKFGGLFIFCYNKAFEKAVPLVYSLLGVTQLEILSLTIELDKGIILYGGLIFI